MRDLTAELEARQNELGEATRSATTALNALGGDGHREHLSSAKAAPVTTPERLDEIRRALVVWMTEPEPSRPGHETCVSTIPASPDDVFWLLDQIETLTKERDLVYGELSKALGPLAPKAWDRIKAALNG